MQPFYNYFCSPAEYIRNLLPGPSWLYLVYAFIGLLYKTNNQSILYIPLLNSCFIYTIKLLCYYKGFFY